MMNALTEKIATLSNEMLVSVLEGINFKKLTPEQTTVRVTALGEYEARLGGEAVDALMDKLEQTAI